MTSVRPLLGPASRGVMIALALVALALRVLTPPGFMIDQHAAIAGYPLVICTGHGPMTLSELTGQPSAPSKSPAGSRSDAPCAFAGQAAAGPVLLLAEIGAASWVLAPKVIGRLRDQAPGRGLAAPPPPAVGPPRPI